MKLNRCQGTDIKLFVSGSICGATDGKTKS